MLNDIDVLGFQWEEAAVPASPPAQSVEFALQTFQRKMPEFVWDSAALEGNPYTYPEVVTLMEGVTVGGHKVSDQAEVQGLINGSRTLATLVKQEEFALSVPVSNAVHRHVGRDVVLDEGRFRGMGSTGGTPSVYTGENEPYYPPETQPGGANLLELHGKITERIIQRSSSPWVQALLYNMAGCFAQFYFDGNKRTSRLMMNGHLMAHGIEPISIPAAKRAEYNRVMVSAYTTRDASGALNFIGNCHERHVRVKQGRPLPPTPGLLAPGRSPTLGMPGGGVRGPGL